MTLLTDFADRYAQATGTRWRWQGREIRCYCLHELDGERHTPSLAFWQTGSGRIAFHDMSGVCSQEKLRQGLVDLGLDAGRRLTREEQEENRRSNQEAHRAGVEAAHAVMASAGAILEGDPIDRYLRDRCIWLFEAEKRFLRVAPDPDNRRAQLFVGMIVDGRTFFNEKIQMSGVQIMPITLNGDPIKGPSGKKWRKVLGRRHSNGVPLGDWNEQVVVGEGIETTLSAMRLLKLPFGWAALSAENMWMVNLPVSCRRVWIAQDNDEGGRLAAAKARSRWEAMGLQASVVGWGAGDANDELMRRGTTNADPR